MIKLNKHAYQIDGYNLGGKRDATQDKKIEDAYKQSILMNYTLYSTTLLNLGFRTA